MFLGSAPSRISGEVSETATGGHGWGSTVLFWRGECSTSCAGHYYSSNIEHESTMWLMKTDAGDL
jgi:hypothetical protein